MAASDVGATPEPLRRIQLPAPITRGEVSLEQTLSERRTARQFAPTPLSLADVGQVLWAAQGLTHPAGFRTAPSAGALYPLEVYLVAGNIDGLAAGIYRYRPAGHELIALTSQDVRPRVAAAALDQRWIEAAPAILVMAAVFQRTAAKYGSRAERYVPMEVGHAAQNVYLQCAARRLATAFVGAFDDRELHNVLDLPRDHAPLGIMPLGHERER